MAEILLLEDDDEMREVLAAVVAAEGHRVLESATIADALERLTQATFDLAILDGQLPDGDGIDFARHLCLIQPQVKVIFLSSAWRDAKATNALRKLGVTEIIHKPVPPVELALRVARVLRSRTGLPAALSSAPERSAPQAFAPSRASAPPQASASSPVLSGHSRDDDGPALRAKPPDSERPTSSPPPVIPVTSSVPVSPAPLAERLTGLRLTYSERLTGKLTELADTLKQARARDGQRHMIERAEYLAHRLRGTAGTYGFMSVSLAAASIESALQVLQRSGDAEVVWRRIDEALQRAEHAQRTPPSSVMPAIRRQAMARVLVVDDDPECLAQLEVLGRAVSLDMIPTSDAAQALEIARREPIDLALVDMCLKGDETPFQLVKDLRGVDGRESLPVACMSANGSIKNRVAAVHAGATLFFEKPIDADELSAFTRRMLEAREAERARILILDDDPEAARGLARLLRGAGWLATTLSDVDRLFEVLGQVQPDLLLLDVMMPISGFDICKALRASPTWQELPVVFLTGATDRRTVVACYGVGGDDYVGKPILPEELLARVRMRIERSRMFRQRAHEDSLTGLLTRAAFSDVVEQRLAEASRRDRPLSLGVIDLDQFKHVNDNHGHLAGDRVLRGLGRLLRSRFRTEDVRGRWGGEEFVIALYEENAETTTAVLDRVLGEFRQMIFESDRGEPFSVTFSAGVASFPADGESLEDLMRRADARLYRAKREGKNHIEHQDDPTSAARAPATPSRLSFRASS